jgi:chemotaxis methyl-accepting protein methylase
MLPLELKGKITHIKDLIEQRILPVLHETDSTHYSEICQFTKSPREELLKAVQTVHGSATRSLSHSHPQSEFPGKIWSHLKLTPYACHSLRIWKEVLSGLSGLFKILVLPS